MNFKISKHIDRIIATFSGMKKISKFAIKFGSIFSAILFAIGTFLLAYSRFALNYDFYTEFIAVNFIKNSVSVLAQFIIGALIFDYVFKQ